MKVKRFEAHDIKTALALVKEELGDEAVILATRTLTAPRKNGSPGVEVVAAVDFDVEAIAGAPEPETPRAGRGTGEKPAMQYGYRQMAANDAGRQQREVQNLNRQSDADPFPAPAWPGDKSEQKKPVHLEAHDLRARFANLLKRHGAPITRQPTPTGAKQGMSNRNRQIRPKPEEVARWRSRVIDQLEVEPLHVKQNGRPTIIALTGPTGVGKTTTAAKIAAWYSLHEGRRVALLSMDCYRIGATDQLRTYAKIMRLPCEIALRKKDLQRAVETHRDKDLILIDTAGKSPFDPHHIIELGEWFEPHADLAPYLVLSATSKKEDLRHIIRAYEPLKPAGLVITKLDETRAYAALCQQIAATRLPISCLCTGQRVPEDFLLANRDFLHILFGKGWNNAMMERETFAGQGAWLQ